LEKCDPVCAARAVRGHGCEASERRFGINGPIDGARTAANAALSASVMDLQQLRQGRYRPVAPVLGGNAANAPLRVAGISRPPRQ